jgi:hypothetical protein
MARPFYLGWDGSICFFFKTVRRHHLYCPTKGVDGFLIKKLNFQLIFFPGHLKTIIGVNQHEINLK